MPFMDDVGLVEEVVEDKLAHNNNSDRPSVPRPRLPG